MAYPFSKLEPKWQEIWQEKQAFKASLDSSRPKYYVLDMFPYPSANGLHVGHAEGYTASDIVARYKRAKGFNVLHPIGWDAYGLPAEQYAIQTGNHPETITRESIANFTRQLKALGFSYDWDREISTCDPKYYRWTQFIFLKLLEKGLAYEKEVAVNWCPALKTVLANEEVVDGKSERGGHPVERRPMRQWMLKITAYADRLLEGLDRLDWPQRTKEAQRNWIGKSQGLDITFSVDGHDAGFDVFTTRPDTLYGVTFMVLAPEHPVLKDIVPASHQESVRSYQDQAQRKSDIDRQASTEKSGVFTGAYALHPVTGDKLPIWIADYVLMDYGTGAIMAVPAHDTRDFEFANAFELPIPMVIQNKAGDADAPFVVALKDAASGARLVNSADLDGLTPEQGFERIADQLEAKGVGKRKTQYRLRDWLFSRQRYWGEPFPVVHYPQAGIQGVDENALPVLLPPLDSFEPSDDGAAPLARASEDWLNCAHPETSEVGQRETNTMPGYAGSSWYFLRYTDPNNDEAPFSFDAQDYWMPVDLYLGGAEHTVGHLLYARFWQKVLHDAGLVTEDEPFQKLIHQGMILGEDGEKMSKSRGNVINPDDVIAEHGADALRLFEMFLGPIDRDKPWSKQGLAGMSKFLNRLWTLLHPNSSDEFSVDDAPASEELRRLAHQTVKKVGDDIEKLSFNTAISQMMILVNAMVKDQPAHGK